jgi:hypothetical protein
VKKRRKSLTETHPEVAKEWHPTKNGDLTPSDVTQGSNKKVWWKCNKGDDHEWEKSISKRAGRGDGCLICSNRKIVNSNCLSTTHLEIAEQWHPTKNGDLTPNKIGSGSNKEIWWKCPFGDDHEWSTRVVTRVGGIGCPVCSNRKIVNSNCLSTTHPEIAEQWHPTKNGDLTPNKIGSGSHKKIWWKCPVGDEHEWNARVYTRARGVGCPICSRFELIGSLNQNLKTLKKNSGILLDKLIEGAIDNETYNKKKKEFDAKLNDNQIQINNLKDYENDLENYTKFSIELFSSLENVFNKCDRETFNEMMSSIFEEKLEFEDENYRTPKLNQSINFIYHEMSKLELENKKTEDNLSNGSRQVHFLNIKNHLEWYTKYLTT